MKVSVCVPIYNVEKYIANCLNSLFLQSYNNIEYIFINDASNDQSIEILKQKLEEFPQHKSKTQIISHLKNKGLAAARNTALKSLTGDFILWVDPDDSIALNAIELLVKKQKESNADIIIFKMCFQFKNHTTVSSIPHNSTPEQLIKAMLCRTTPVGVCGKFIKASLYKDFHIEVEEGINMGEDFQTTPRLVYYSKQISFLDKVLYYYNKTNENAYTKRYSISKSRQIWRSIEILESFFSDKDPQFNYYLQVSKLKQIAWDSIGYAKYKENLSYLKEKRKFIKKIDFKLWKFIEKAYYPILFFDNIKFIVFYIRTTSKIKNILK
jgi:glycosyltransferase involved in cell wall biosynthesis